MMTANVAGNPQIGPWVIPQRAQNMITGYYAKQNGFDIDINIPEPLFSDALMTTCCTKNNTDFQRLILCSIHQLPKKDFELMPFLDVMADVEFHFVLEGLSGTGREFLMRMAKEADVFCRSETLDINRYTSYRDLFDETLGKEAP